jgi:hypothetical protein
MGTEINDRRSIWDCIVMVLCVFVMVLLLLMTSSSFTPDFHEVYHAIRWSEAQVMSGLGILPGHFL